jgi:hypothetical protein
MKILIYTQTDKNSPDCFRLRLRNENVAQNHTAQRMIQTSCISLTTESIKNTEKILCGYMTLRLRAVYGEAIQKFTEER